MATEQEIRAAVAEADRVLAAGAPSQLAGYSREMFLELARRDRRDALAPATAGHTERRPREQANHPRPVSPAAGVELTPEAVAGWSAELGFHALPNQGRVTRAAD